MGEVRKMVAVYVNHSGYMDKGSVPYTLHFQFLYQDPSFFIQLTVTITFI